MLAAIKSKFQLLFAFIGLFIALSIVAFISTAKADDAGTTSATISHTPSDINLAADQVETEYISPQFATQFPYNGVGIVWTGPTTDGVAFSVQADDGAWYPAEMIGEDAKDAAEQFTSVPIFIDGEQIRYKITGHNAHTVQNVRLIYFDSTIPPYKSLASTLKQSIVRAVTGETAVISRSEWGADESYRTWEPDYATPEKIVIHHSAGGDGGDDPAATIRGIYYWHAVVLGWGDIGYNYIIDPAGQVYEGRYGGDGVIGGHAYNSDTDTNYNVGSIGVMLMGCYEEADGACATVHTMTTAMTESLEQLAAEKAAVFGFDPSAEADWYGEVVPNLLSHRDIDSTYCPGSSVYDQLDTIRAAAHDLYGTIHIRRYAATYSGSTIADSYTVAATPDVSVSYANTGRKIWNKNNVVLQVTLVETGERHRFTLTDSVEDGSVAAITGSLQLPTLPGTYTLMSRLYRNGQPIHGSKHQTSVVVENPYQVKVIAAQFPTAIQQGWETTVHLTIRNTGVTLPAGTTITVDGTTIATTAKDWPTGEKRLLAFPITTSTDWAVGTHVAVIKLYVDDIVVSKSRTVRTIRID